MAKKHIVEIDQNQCVGCGLCMKDCVSGVIQLERGKAVAGEVGCIACGHCEAICPQRAIFLTGFEEGSEEYEEQTRLDPETLLRAIKTRRSIRQFQDKKVPKSIIREIIEAGRLAPTGGNSQSTGYIILDGKKRLLESMAVNMFQTLAKPFKAVIPFVKKMNIDDDFFFKGAPLVIVITGNAVNASLAAENMAFMAEAHGLGVLYSGFYTMCTNYNPKIRRVMKMKRGEKAVTTLVIGYPAVKYHRTVRREPAKVRII